MVHGSSIKNSTLGLTAAVTVVVLGLRLIPFALPRLWGINHLLFASNEFFIAYIALAVLTLVCFLPPVAVVAGNGYRTLSGFLLGERSPMRWLVAAVVALVAFWMLRLPVYLLGDSFSVTANLSGETPVIFKWTESGAIFLAALLARFVSGETAYNLLSVLSGAATVFLFFGIAYELGRGQVERLFIVGLQLFAGWVVLFLGYTENYPVLWPFICGYIYFSLKYLKGTGGLFVPAVFLLAAMTLHLQTIFFLLSFAFLLFSHGRPGRLYRLHRSPALITSGIVVIALAAAAFWLYRHSLEFRMYVMPLTAGQGRLADYTLFSPSISIIPRPSITTNICLNSICPAAAPASLFSATCMPGTIKRRLSTASTGSWSPPFPNPISRPRPIVSWNRASTSALIASWIRWFSLTNFRLSCIIYVGLLASSRGAMPGLFRISKLPPTLGVTTAGRWSTWPGCTVNLDNSTACLKCCVKRNGAIRVSMAWPKDSVPTISPAMPTIPPSSTPDAW